MVDEAPDSANRLPASAGGPRTKDDAEVAILPKATDGAETGLKPASAAGAFVGMMEMQTGAAALAASFERLPEPIQKQALENEAKRDQQAYELESKQLQAMAADRESARQDHRLRFEKILAHKADHRRRVFWLVAAGAVVSAIGTGLLGWAGQWKIAEHLINTLAAGGLGYLAGRGESKTGKQRQLASGDQEKDKDDE